MGSRDASPDVPPAMVAAPLAAMGGAAPLPPGCTVVLSLSEAAVQALVSCAWGQGGPPGGLPAGGVHELRWVAPAAVDGVHDAVSLRAALPPPRVTLGRGGVDLSFAIEAGTLRLGKAPAAFIGHDAARGNAAGVAGQGVEWGPPRPAASKGAVYLTGTAPLVAAADGDGFAISLDLAAAQVGLAGDGLEGLDGREVAQSLRDWLPRHALDGRIATLRRGGATTVLTPSAVAAGIGVTAAGRPVLRIAAGPGTAAPAPGGVVLHPEGHDVGIAVDAAATMAMLADGYNRGAGEVKLVAMPSGDGRASPFVEVREPMVFEGSLGIEHGETFASQRAVLRMRFGGGDDGSLRLFTCIDPGATIALKLDLAARFPVGIVGAGAEQRVGLARGTQSVDADGFYEAIVRPQLERFLKGDIAADMAGVRFDALSDLLLRDLALVGHALRFDAAALPAGLVVAASLSASAASGTAAGGQR